MNKHCCFFFIFYSLGNDLDPNPKLVPVPERNRELRIRITSQTNLCLHNSIISSCIQLFICPMYYSRMNKRKGKAKQSHGTAASKLYIFNLNNATTLVQFSDCIFHLFLYLTWVIGSNSLNFFSLLLFRRGIRRPVVSCIFFCNLQAALGGLLS